jgi:hypothetical protein
MERNRYLRPADADTYIGAPPWADGNFLRNEVFRVTLSTRDLSMATL